MALPERVYLPFEGTAIDLHGNTVNVNGAPIYVADTTVGRSVYLHNNDSIAIPNSTAIELSHITVALWLRITSQTNWQIYVSKCVIFSNAFEAGWLFSTCSATENHLDQMGFYINSHTNRVLSGSGTITTGTWYHVAGTHDGATMRLYLNGMLRASQSYAEPILNDRSFGPALRVNTITKGFVSCDCRVKNLRVIDKSLPEHDIRRLMHGFNPLTR